MMNSFKEKLSPRVFFLGAAFLAAILFLQIIHIKPEYSRYLFVQKKTRQLELRQNTQHKNSKNGTSTTFFDLLKNESHAHHLVLNAFTVNHKKIHTTFSATYPSVVHFLIKARKNFPNMRCPLIHIIKSQPKLLVNTELKCVLE